LVRRVCKSCGGSATVKQSVDGGGKYACEVCRDSGYKGREGIYELLLITDQIRQQIQDRAHAAHLRDAGVAEGMRLLREWGQDKVALGPTTLEEVERVTMRANCKRLNS
jgi:general secretion pathway protein E